MSIFHASTIRRSRRRMPVLEDWETRDWAGATGSTNDMEKRGEGRVTATIDDMR